jgi:hypothetical protein
VLGSKDESGGCQGCVMTHLGDNRFALQLRLNGATKRHLALDVAFCSTRRSDSRRCGSYARTNSWSFACA